MINQERIHTTDHGGLELIDALRAFIPAVMRKNQTPGLNIALADKGKLIWEAGFGLADVSANRPMTCDTVYHSGSLGKTYTATAVMILVDRGVLSLDDDINKHLPFEVHNPLGARAITVKDLLTHTSGLGVDAAGCGFDVGPGLAEILRREYAQSVSPMFLGTIPRWANPVGETHGYSNVGIATLGLIVQTANREGLSYSDFVQRNIMDPLGMTHSCYPPAQHVDLVPPHIWKETSQGYTRMGLADVPTPTIYLNEFPAGGALQRPADHVRLLLAMTNGGELDGHRLFARQTAEAMISPAIDLPASALERMAKLGFEGHQGLVWRINDHGFPWMSFDHPGGHMWGWQTQGRAWPGSNAAVMVAVNQWSLPRPGTEFLEIPDFVGGWLRNRPTVTQNDPVTLGASKLSYVRGAIHAICSGAALGTEGQMPEGQLDAMIEGVRSRGQDWDPPGLPTRLLGSLDPAQNTGCDPRILDLGELRGHSGRSLRSLRLPGRAQRRLRHLYRVVLPPIAVKGRRCRMMRSS